MKCKDCKKGKLCKACTDKIPQDKCPKCYGLTVPNIIECKRH